MPRNMLIHDAVHHVTRLHLSTHTIDVRSYVKNHAISVVLIHGVGVSGKYYIPFATLLSRFYNVYIVDLPGYGATPKPSVPLTIVQLAGVAAEFIEQVGIEAPIVVGQSMGCQIVAHMIRQRPNGYQKAILLSPTVNAAERTFFHQTFRLLQDSIREPLRVNSIVWGDYARMGMRRYLKTVSYMLNDHIEKTITTAQLPLLVVRGEKDPIVPKEWALLVSRRAPTGVFFELKNAPHIVQYKYAIRLAEVCRDFIEE